MHLIHFEFITQYDQSKFLLKSIVINVLNITLIIDSTLWVLIQPCTQTVNVPMRFETIPSFLDVMLLSLCCGRHHGWYVSPHESIESTF